jgi:hypothetical protein
MSSPDLHPNKLSNLRRSQRVCLSVPVVVSKRDTLKPEAEETRTLIVSAHGALLALRMAVQFGDLLTLQHKKTQEQLVCKVVNFSADQGSGQREVGVEFETPSPKFWRIAFPPADWTPRGPDSKPPTPQPPGGWKRPTVPTGAKPAASKPVPPSGPATPTRS